LSYPRAMSALDSAPSNALSCSNSLQFSQFSAEAESQKLVYC
jgi:hypothetical protein